MQILCGTRDTIPWTCSSKVSLLSNFIPRMSSLWLAWMETPDMTKSPWGGFTVLDLLTTNALVLLGFSFMHQWLLRSWILAMSWFRDRGSNSLDLLAGEQLPVLWSHLDTHIVKQLFTNNNYPFKLINEIITTFINKKRNTEPPDNSSVPEEKINIF